MLLIGCANVASLLLARASARRREVAVRIALGAGVARIVRLCLFEAALVSGAGVVAGLLLGSWLADVLVHLAPADIPGMRQVGMSWIVFAFAAALGLLTTVVTGLAPALQAIRSDVSAVRPDLRSATERSAGLRRWLIAGEIAIVVLLLTSALLLMRTFVKLRGVDLGFDTDHVVEVEARWPIGTLFGTGGRGQQWPRVQRAVDGLLQSVAAIPGVEAAGLVTEPPLTGGDTAGVGWRADAAGAHELNPPSDPRDVMKADVAIVSPGYFAAAWRSGAARKELHDRRPFH